MLLNTEMHTKLAAARRPPAIVQHEGSPQKGAEERAKLGGPDHELGGAVGHGGVGVTDGQQGSAHQAEVVPKQKTCQGRKGCHEQHPAGAAAAAGLLHRPHCRTDLPLRWAGAAGGWEVTRR